MKIVLTGGCTGGHFYPIIAVAEELRRMEKEEGMLELKLIFTSSDPYDQEELNRLSIDYKEIKSGKVRTYSSSKNFFDIFRVIYGTVQAFFFILLNYPDVVFGKGGHGSFPTLFAARVLGVPVVIHESDSVPGRVNTWAGKFAKKVFISFPESAKHFPDSVTEVSGRPISKEISEVREVEGAREFLHIKEDIPVILIMGGSQGSDIINSIIVETVTDLVEKYYVIHQTGRDHIQAVKLTAQNILRGSTNADRYKPFDFFNRDGMKRAAYLSDIVISRAGSTLFEIAAWGKPSILVPYVHAHGNHQYHNAFSYAHEGACTVIEEDNLSSSILKMEIENIMEDTDLKERMSKSARAFHRPDAAQRVAGFLVDIGKSHYRSDYSV